MRWLDSEVGTAYPIRKTTEMILQYPKLHIRLL